MEILRLVWMACEWKGACKNTSRNARARMQGWPVLVTKDTTDSKQTGKHCGMCGLHQDQEVCDVIRLQHRWLINRRPVR